LPLFVKEPQELSVDTSRDPDAGAGGWDIDGVEEPLPDGGLKVFNNNKNTL
jgi:hypothetical protein